MRQRARLNDAKAAKLEHPMKKEKENVEPSYKVSPIFRVNPLHEQGGSYTVKVSYADEGRPTKVYDNVRYPDQYINKIKSSSEYVEGIIKEITYTKSTKGLLKG